MNILILGNENDIKLPKEALKSSYNITTNVIGNHQSDATILNFQTLSFYDCIIIAIVDENEAKNLYQLLLAILNNDNSRLLNFYFWYHVTVPAMTVDRAMENPYPPQYDGIILGISHAEVGILPQLLHGTFCNLAVSSQDIYYNMKTMEYCISNYYDKIKNLKYLIFDMFDYTYFNYDVSLSKTAGIYYNNNGFTLDSHNFHANKSFQDTSFDKIIEFILMKRVQGTNTSQWNLWNELYANIHSHNQYDAYTTYMNISKRTRIVTDEEIEEYNADTSIVKNIFHDTIRDNIQFFYRLLNLIYGINPSAKVFCILMPKYYAVQKKSEALYAPWKEMFYEIMEASQKNYPFTFLDLKDNEISQSRTNYFDISHLNYYGAIQFTQLLDTIIFS